MRELPDCGPTAVLSHGACYGAPADIGANVAPSSLSAPLTVLHPPAELSPAARIGPACRGWTAEHVASHASTDSQLECGMAAVSLSLNNDVEPTSDSSFVRPFSSSCAPPPGSCVAARRSPHEDGAAHLRPPAQPPARLNSDDAHSSAESSACAHPSRGASNLHASPQCMHASNDSRVLAMPSHCPEALQRRVWHIQQFKLEKVLYVGTISRVLRAVDLSTGMTVALKVYKRHKLSEMDKYQVAREIRMHSELHHSNIISLYCAWKDCQYIYVAVELAPYGDVFSMLKKCHPRGVDETTCVTQIFRPLLSALSFIHAKGLIHRDIKPENILLGDGHSIKLSDFGLSINQHAEVANTRLGTLNYIAPEILRCPFKRHPLDNKEASAMGYDNKVDIWSLGVLAYELLSTLLPFNGGAMLETLQNIMSNQIRFPPSISPLARNFILCCLQSNPAQRPTIEELAQHPWIAGHHSCA